MSKKFKQTKTNLKIGKNSLSIAEVKISVSFQYLSKNKQRNFEFFSKKDFRTKAQAMEQFFEFLQKLTSKTRLDISLLSKTDVCGFEELPIDQINCTPSAIVLSNDIKICVFRFGNNGSGGDYRLLGFFDFKNPILYIIGFDFNYSAYKH